MKGTILLTDMISAMGKGNPFDIEYVTADTRRGTGGKLVSHRHVVLSNKMGRSNTGIGLAEPRKSKNPNHSAHSTFNIYVPSEQNARERVKKVHLRLVTRFNGMEVL